MRCAVLSVFCVCLFVFGFVVCRSASPHFGGALTADVGRPSSSADLVVPGQPVKASALWDVVLLGVATDVTTVFAAVAHVLFTNDSGVCSVLAFVTSVCLRWVYTFFFFFAWLAPPPNSAASWCEVHHVLHQLWLLEGEREEGGGGRVPWCHVVLLHVRAAKTLWRLLRFLEAFPAVWLRCGRRGPPPSRNVFRGVSSQFLVSLFSPSTGLFSCAPSARGLLL